MAKNITSIILSFVFIFSLVPLSNGFDNNPNKDATTTDPNDQRPYTRENAIKPISEGGYYGGHDTITSEGMLLKKEVHKENEDFKRWADLNLNSLRIGAHDEDTNEWLNWYINDPPIGENGWGDFFQHFYNPDTGKGLKGIWNPSTIHNDLYDCA